MTIINFNFQSSYRALVLTDILFSFSCNTSELDKSLENDETPISFYYGADLFYVSEMTKYYLDSLLVFIFITLF